MNLATIFACAICRTALTDHVEDGINSYRHPVADKRHAAVPVDTALLPHVENTCHTCSDEPPIWNYRTGRIELLSLETGAAESYNNQWHVGARCAQLIEADDSAALTDRCAGFMGWRPGSAEHAALHAIHHCIVIGRDHRTLLTTTDWPPARITADMLPKIRDRLAQLLRSPARLPQQINEPSHRQAIASQLDLAAMYWINHEFTDITNEVSEHRPPAIVTSEVVPSPSGLVAWPAPVGARRRLAAASWTSRADGWDFIGYRSIGGITDDDLMPSLRHEIGWLAPIHVEHITSGAALDGRHPLGPLMTTWLLINQQMAETVPAKLPKATTKAYHRSQRPAPDVRIVQIRPRSGIPSEPVGAAGTRTRAKPDHRFWVSGHDRQQAYGPGRSLRRTVEIQPFLKGSDDLPIKLSTTVRILNSGTRPSKSDSGSE
ncbi:MAG: hypothetical protein QOH97_5524 [Actinoplanes sp.]|nr:hypothetical protein [Actinoplanes sp.]